jgi:hypothetical protein
MTYDPVCVGIEWEREPGDETLALREVTSKYLSSSLLAET